LALDREVGDFVEKEDSEETGYWKLKNDSVMLLNDSRYHFKLTGRNPDTIKIRNLQRGDSMQIIDTHFPPNLYEHSVVWTDIREKAHYAKWGYGIKQIYLLQGYDYKLWRSENIPPDLYDPHRPERLITVVDTPPPPVIDYDEYQLFPGSDTVYSTYPLYYYCTFNYFDKYGKRQRLYLTGERWSFENPYSNPICCDDLVDIHHWAPAAGNDTVYVYYGDGSRLSYSNDTLYFHNLEINDFVMYCLSVNLPPKSKKAGIKNKKKK
jgi:hypothetical protein